MRKIFSFLLSLTIFTSYAQKDSTDIYDMNLEQLMNMQISGVSRYKQDVSDIPNTITVINHKQIVDRGYFDLSDLLKDIQGFDISANAARFGEFYSLRGIAGNDRFLVLINGHKLNPATGTFLSVGKSISIRHAERVEVVYGPASAVYGADAYSGIINIVLADEAMEETKASAYIDYGNLNSMDAGASVASFLGKDFSIFLSSRIYKSEGYEVVGSDPIYDIIKNYTAPIKNSTEQPTNDKNIFLKFQYKNMSLNYYRQQFDQGNAIGHAPNIYIFDKENKWKTTTDIIWYNYKKQIASDGELMFDLSYKYHYQDPNTIFHKWNKSGEIGKTYKQHMTGKDNTLHGVLTFHHHLAENFQFIIGIDNEYTSSIPPYANDEVLGVSDKYTGESKTKIDNELTLTENRFSAFTQVTYSPIDLFTLVAGARYDNSSRYGDVLNPRFGFIISPFETTALKFNYGRAFQAPSLFLQYEQFGTPRIVMLSTRELKELYPSWKLENQIVNSYEVSVNQNFGKNIKFKVGGYYNQLSNLIERKLFNNSASTYNKYFDKNTNGLRNENIGSQEIYGVDFAINAKVLRNLILYTYYSYTDAKSKLEGGTETGIPRISEHKAWVGFCAQNLFGHLTVSPRFRWIGDMYNANTSVYSDNKQPGFQTLDISLSLNNLSQYVRLYANFNNILDEKAAHGGLYGQSGIYTPTIPQPGFNFKVGLEFLLNSY